MELIESTPEAPQVSLVKADEAAERIENKLATLAPVSMQAIEPPEQENEVHLAAFKYYYQLGPDRSLGDCAKHFRIRLATIQKWAENFNWAGRIQILDRRTDEEVTEDLLIWACQTKVRSGFDKDPFGRLTFLKDSKTLKEIGETYCQIAELRMKREAEKTEKVPGKKDGRVNIQTQVNIFYKKEEQLKA